MFKKINKKEYKEILFNDPFLWGVFSGLVTGNISLGLISTGFAVLFFGYQKYSSYIVVGTTVTVFMTGNINFELILIYYLTVIGFQEKNMIFPFLDKRKGYLFVAIVSILLIPFWSFLFGYIPVVVLDKINIAGIFLLMTGIIAGLRRGVRVVRVNRFDSRPIVMYVIIFLLALLGITGAEMVILTWLIGMVIIYKIKLTGKKVSFSPIFLLFLMVVMALIAVAFLLPVNWFLYFFSIILGIYIYKRQSELISLELVYGSFLMGLIMAGLDLLY